MLVVSKVRVLVRATANHLSTVSPAIRLASEEDHWRVSELTIYWQIQLAAVFSTYFAV